MAELHQRSKLQEGCCQLSIVTASTAAYQDAQCGCHSLGSFCIRVSHLFLCVCMLTISISCNLHVRLE